MTLAQAAKTTPPSLAQEWPPDPLIVQRLNQLYGDESAAAAVPMLERVSIAAEAGAMLLRDSIAAPTPPPVLLSLQAGELADDVIRSRSPSVAEGRSRASSVQGLGGRSRASSVQDSGVTGGRSAAASREGSPVRAFAIDGVQDERDVDDDDEKPLERTPVELDEMVRDGSRHTWSAIAPSSFSVRGAAYLQDGIKVSAPLLSQCLAVELFRAPAAVPNVAGRAGSPLASLKRRCDVPLKTVFVVVVIIPTGRFVVHIAMYFGVYAEIDAAAPAAASLLEKFVRADDDYRNLRFKIFTKVRRASHLTAPRRASPQLSRSVDICPTRRPGTPRAVTPDELMS